MSVSILVSTNTHKISQYAYLVFVYFNNEKPPLKFRFREMTRLVDLKSIVERFYPYNQRVMQLYYRSPSIDNKGKI